MARVVLLFSAIFALAQADSFLHGVASGDPLSDRIILWTRVTPSLPEASTSAVTWRVWRADDTPTPSEPVAQGVFMTSAVIVSVARCIYQSHLSLSHFCDFAIFRFFCCC
jgi:phosphodiesterase/alkaline phosphatase D-like protein